ncbi:MAG: arginine repressor [Oscillospiraceae bacterium]
MKSERHAKILQLILDHSIETQEDLLAKLHEEKIFVTQATVSRDIKELRLAKIQDSDGKYKYVTTAKDNQADISFKFHAIFTESVIEVDYAQNIIVVRCYTGMANAACASLDSIHWKGVVGSLAGDDTIFVLMKDETYAAELANQLKKILKTKNKNF